MNVLILTQVDSDTNFLDRINIVFQLLIWCRRRLRRYEEVMVAWRWKLFCNLYSYFVFTWL